VFHSASPALNRVFPCESLRSLYARYHRVLIKRK
jgi:hypothetical protein